MLAITDNYFSKLENYCKNCVDDKELPNHIKIPNLIFTANNRWSTLLEMAIKCDNYRFIDYLLSKGYDINFGIDEYYPAMYTIWPEKIRTLVFLIKRGSHILLDDTYFSSIIYNPTHYILMVYGVDYMSTNKYINNELLLAYLPEL
jgi:hypothetical protein